VTEVSTTTVTNPDGSTTTTQIQQMPDGSWQKVTTHTLVDGTRVITTQKIDAHGNPIGDPTVVTVPPGQTVPIPTSTVIPDPTAPTTTPVESSDCWPSGSAAWNPAEWVLAPIKCGLTWAFVPRTATLGTLMNSATTDLTAVGIAPLISAVGANFSNIGTGTGCIGPAVTFSAVGITKPLHPFSACESPMSTLATICKALSTIGIVVVGGFGCIRAVGAGFGFDVSMGRGKAEA
jgi:hypothetical protein